MSKSTHQYLNSKEINVEEQDKRKTSWAETVDGLEIRVSHTGRKSFFVMYRNNYLTTLADSAQKESKRIIDKPTLPDLGSNKVDEITPDDIRDVRKKVKRQTRKGEKTDDKPKAGHRMANRVKDTISSIYSNNKSSAENSCKDVDKLPERSGEEIELTPEQIQTLWEILESEPLITGSLIKMLLINGQRINKMKRMR